MGPDAVWPADLEIEVSEEEWQEYLESLGVEDATHEGLILDEDEPEIEWSPEELLEQAEHELAEAYQKIDWLNARCEANQIMRQDAADRFAQELYKRKKLEVQLAQYEALAIGLRIAVRDENGDVHLQHLPVQLPEGHTYD